jgi:hypothetical protein
MSERFIKFFPSEEAMWLLDNKPNAFRLLAHIAKTARRYNGHPDGLTIGQCHLEHWTKYNLTEREYRTAKDILVKRARIKIVETNRTRKKSTTASTTKSTLVQLLDSMVWDINPDDKDDRNDDRETTDRRLTDDKQDDIRMTNMNKSHHHQTSSSKVLMIDDFSSKIEFLPGIFLSQEQIDQCIKLKGSVESVKYAINFIQNSDKRVSQISDWPHALSKWRIPNKIQINIQENIAFSESLCKEFSDFKKGNGTACRMHQDKIKDIKGILFLPYSSYTESVFIPFTDCDFNQKCCNIINNKNMRKNEHI